MGYALLRTSISGVTLCVALLTAFFPVPSYGDPLQDAYAAYQRGDYSTALSGYTKLANQGNAHAQHGLGIMYSNGHGVPQSLAEAANWFRKAALQGLPMSMTALGSMYNLGEGVRKNQTEAIRWWRMAAEKGDAGAQGLLGEAYERGEGVKKDYRQALRLYELSANQGDPMSQLKFGMLLGSGEAGKTDLVEAYKWIAIAAPQFSGAMKEFQQLARETLADIEKHLNADQLKLARDRAATWQPPRAKPEPKR